VLKLRLEPAMTPGTKTAARLGATGRQARKKLLEGERARERRREVEAMAIEVQGMGRRVVKLAMGGRRAIGVD
jgi:hypothetical protein